MPGYFVLSSGHIITAARACLCTMQSTCTHMPAPPTPTHSAPTQRVLLTTWHMPDPTLPAVSHLLWSLEQLFKRLYNSFDKYIGESGSEVHEVSEDEYVLRAEMLHALLSAVKDLCTFRILGMVVVHWVCVGGMNNCTAVQYVQRRV